MINQTVTLQMPSALYLRLQQRATKANRSLEDETIDLLASTVSVPDELVADLQQTLVSLELLDDDALLRAARTRLADDIASELESLHFKQQREGLTEAELHRHDELIRSYERTMLIRAQAAALLKKRGKDVSTLVAFR